MTAESIKKSFIDIFQTEPVLVKSPGRINIIGEHTDYNGGLVMPAAIDKGVYVAIAKRDDQEIHLYAESYQSTCISSVAAIKKTELSWANYILGVANEFVQRGHQLSGFNLYIYGNVPLGAGLSSSAAVECATALALQYINGLSVSKMELAWLSQKAEHTFAGVNCGIMDQFAAVFGKKDHAMMLDCRSMEYEYIPLKLEGYKFVLLNTNVKHSLSDSAYNERREQCDKGVSWIKAHHPEVRYLRDADLAMLEEHVKPKDENVYLKCKYVVNEIERVKKAAHALKNGGLKELGTLMFQTHEGLSKDYEVSCKELDFLVNQVKGLAYVLGARMMGGGFGGCTINVVKEKEIDALVDKLSSLYLNEFGLKLDAYIVETGNGVEVI